MSFIGLLTLGLNNINPGEYVAYKTVEDFEVSKVKNVLLNSVVELDNGDFVSMPDLHDLVVELEFPNKNTVSQAKLTPYQWKKVLKHDYLGKYIRVKLEAINGVLHAEFLGPSIDEHVDGVME